MTTTYTDTAQSDYQQKRITHWNQVAHLADSGWSNYYHQRLTEIYQFLIAPHQRILEIGCGKGDLLAALQPSHGVGIDFSPDMISSAQQRHPHLQFICVDIHNFTEENPFDIIILSDVINDLWDVQTILQQIAKLCKPHTRLILNWYSRLWEMPLTVAKSLGIAKPVLYQNWLTVPDIANLFYLTGFEITQCKQEIACPLSIPLFASLSNHYLVKMLPFSWFALTNVVVARPHPQTVMQEPLVSVIVPARNEAGNIAQIFARVPEMGRGTELVFVEGHSKDDTYKAIEQHIAANPQRRCKLFQQTGAGKGDAVRLGFAQASGDILMILDADLTVPPEDLPRFYEALRSGKGEFINGVRLVYPMQEGAMRPLNFLANKFFSWAFSWLLGQPIKDTLCGTKVLWKSDYEKIAANRAYFGDFDPFGDFDLLFGAAKQNLKILDLPIRYRERIYGTTNIQRWRHGWLLLKMVAFAARRIKFV